MNRYLLCQTLDGRWRYYDNNTGEYLPWGVTPHRLTEAIEYINNGPFSEEEKKKLIEVLYKIWEV